MAQRVAPGPATTPPEEKKGATFLNYNAAHIAVAYGDASTLKRIMQHEPKLIEQADIHGHTPFDLALSLGNPQIAEAFAQHHIQQNKQKQNENIQQLLTQSLQQKVLLVKNIATTSRSAALLQSKPQQLKYLKPGDKKYTQLEALFAHLSDASKTFNAKKIKKQSDLYLNYADEDGVSALELAIAVGNDPAVAFFIAEGVPLYNPGPDWSRYSPYILLKIQIQNLVRFVQAYIKGGQWPASHTAQLNGSIKFLQKGFADLPNSCEALLTTASKS